MVVGKTLGTIVLLFGTAHTSATATVAGIKTWDGLQTQTQTDGTLINDAIACFDGTLNPGIHREKYELLRQMAVSGCATIRMLIG